MKKLSIIILITLVVFMGCKKDDTFIENSKNTNYGDEIILGKKLNNPYTISNMQMAFGSLPIASKMELSPTDLYVRILPKSGEEVDYLEQDLDLSLFTHPLDYEFKQDGDHYNDPDFVDKEFQWFYTVVPIDFNFGNLHHEILDKVFLYHEDRVNQVSEELFDMIELESEFLTGNISEEEYNDYKSARKKKQTVRGCVTAFDNVVVGNRVPVKGVKIRAIRFVKIANTFTNAQGCFEFNTKFRQATVRAIAEDVFGNRARGASSNMILLDLVRDIRHSFGNFSGSQLSNINYHFHFDNPNTGGRKKWVAFSTLDAAWDYNNISASNFQINRRISNRNVWVSNAANEFAAPNLRHLRQNGSTMVIAANSTIVGLLSFLGLPGWIYSAMITNFPPDFYHTFRRAWTANQYRQTFFHEFGHNFQYQRCGNRCWEDYILHVVANGGDGDGNQPNSGLLQVMESWTEDYSLSVATVYYQNYGVTNMSGVLFAGSQTYNHLNERRRGLERSGFIAHGYYYDLQDVVDLPTETILFQGQWRDFFSGWTYRVQLESMTNATRSYEIHRRQMQQMQQPTSTANVTDVLNNIIRQRQAF